MKVPSGPATGPSGSGLLVDASYRAEGAPGLTDLRARSGGEGEVGARSIGTYWFATRIYEITSPTRPASPGTTSTVEACHPLVTGSTPPQQGQDVDPSLCSVVSLPRVDNDAARGRIPRLDPVSLASILRPGERLSGDSRTAASNAPVTPRYHSPSLQPSR